MTVALSKSSFAGGAARPPGAQAKARASVVTVIERNFSGLVGRDLQSPS
jgi:hypothetical protein